MGMIQRVMKMMSTQKLRHLMVLEMASAERLLLSIRQEQCTKIRLRHLHPHKSHHQSHGAVSMQIIQDLLILIVANAYSNRPQAKLMKNYPTSENTIEHFVEMFSFHGLPSLLVLDDATILFLEEFEGFTETYKIVHRFSALNNLPTNGFSKKNVLHKFGSHISTANGDAPNNTRKLSHSPYLQDPPTPD